MGQSLYGGARPTSPLCIHFNVAVQRIARVLFPCGYDVAEEAPDNLADLTAHIERTGRMLVFSGGSEQTIFDCAETNYAFRAWHDWCHWKGQHEMDLPGEIAVAQMMKGHLRQLYEGNPLLSKWCDIIDAEVYGQTAHQIETGQFPVDQCDFVEGFLADRQMHRTTMNAHLAA